MNRKPLTFVLSVALAVLLLAGLQAAVSKKSEAPQWEYKIVLASGPVSANDNLEQKYTNMLNELGAEGWELVLKSRGLHKHSTEESFVLKRPRSR